MQVPKIEGIIRHVGLAPTKAKNLSKMSKVSIPFESNNMIYWSLAACS